MLKIGSYRYGNEKKFAIEFIISYINKSDIYGTIYYWIKGIKFGNDENYLIADSIRFLKWMVFDNNKRKHELFYNMDNKKVLSYLSGNEFKGDDEISDEVIRKANIEQWSKFNISMDLISLDDIYIFLIEGDENSRLIYGLQDEKINEIYIENGYVERVIADAYMFVYNNI